MSGIEESKMTAPQGGPASQIPSGNATLFLLTSGILLLCGLMLLPFVPAITGAVVLAVITHRPREWWFHKLRNRTAATSSALLIVTIIIIAPALLLFHALARNVLAGARLLQDGSAQRSFDAFLIRYPQIATAIEHKPALINFDAAMKNFAGVLASHLLAVLSNSVAALSQIAIMLFLLFFIYRDEALAVAFLKRLLPLSEDEAHDLFSRLVGTIRATVLGRLAISISQGCVASVVFTLLNFHAAIMLGALTAAVSLIPAFGAYIVWAPIAIYLALTAQWIKMAILIATGSLVISTLDNLLYPVLVGSQLRQHTAIVFVSLLGGIALFGVSGLVLGPVLFSAAESVLSICKSRLYVTRPVP